MTSPRGLPVAGPRSGARMRSREAVLPPGLAASLPFLLALADDPRVPDRAAVIQLLLSIGSAAPDCDPDGVYYGPSGRASTPHADVVPQMRGRVEDFVRHASDPDPQVRQAALPALGLFLDDADRAFALLRERLAAEDGTLERLLVIETAATPARRLPTALDPVTTWLATLAADTALDADIRLAAAEAVWALERDPADAVPRLTDLLDTHKQRDAADVLGRIGAPAAAALPHLRQMLHDAYEGTRVQAAAAIHDIGGPAEADVVPPVLLEAWEENDSTAHRVLRCLQRMGPAAAPALPRIRAELALARRSGDLFKSVEEDEALQRTGLAVVDRLG